MWSKFLQASDELFAVRCLPLVEWVTIGNPTLIANSDRLLSLI